MGFLKEIAKYLLVNAVVWAALIPTHAFVFLEGDPLELLAGLSLFTGIPAVVVIGLANPLVWRFPGVPLRIPLAVGLLLAAAPFLPASTRALLVVQLVIQAGYLLVARPIWSEEAERPPVVG